MSKNKTEEQAVAEQVSVSDQSTSVPGENTANVPLSRLPRTFFSRRWWWATILVLILMAVFVRLGIWQLGRRQERLASNAAYLAQISQSPVTINTGLVAAGPEDLVDRSATVQGQYDHEQQIVLTQQSWLGRPGAHLVTPLVLEDGKTAVLVDRGWIPAADAESGDLEQFDEPGQQTINGAIQLSQTLSGGRQTEVDGPQRQWYRIDIEAIQQQMPYRLLPFYLLQTPPENAQGDLPFRVAVEIDLSEGPHLGYAIQWFLFAVFLAVGYARLVSTHDSRPQSQDEPR